MASALNKHALSNLTTSPYVLSECDIDTPEMDGDGHVSLDELWSIDGFNVGLVLGGNADVGSIPGAIVADEYGSSYP